MKLTLGQIADWIHAEGDFDSHAEALAYSIDSRTIGAGELFFAVKGERADGHDFVEAAMANGAVAAVVSQRWLAPANFDECRLLRVPDDCEDCVLGAMQGLARRVRESWAAHGGKRVIGITGSAGKTTTKECVAAVLQTTFNVLKTEGNLNNHFGVPLQLLRLQPEHDVAVLEMGMNHAGEIRALARIAKPDWAVVSNVAAVHLEFFPEGIAGIARAKYELVESLPEDGVAFLNADDPYVAAFGEGMGARAVFYGTGADAHLRAGDIEDHGLSGTDFTLSFRSGNAHRNEEKPGSEGKPASGAWTVVLRLPGRHNVLNALAAIAVGMASGVKPLDAMGALEKLRPGAKRGEETEWRGARLINDTYNSNPAALQSMVRALRSAEARRRIVVAGEMLELGSQGSALHRESGAAMCGVDVVVGVRGLAREMVAGAEAAGVPTTLFLDTPAEAGAWLRANLRAGDVVLLKASRGVRLEGALEALREP